MNSHILTRIRVRELHIFLCSKSIFLKQLEVLSLKKHKVMLFLPSQYQHSKFSRFEIGGFKKAVCLLTGSVHSSSSEISPSDI